MTTPNVAALLKAWRAQARLTQAEAAERLGVNLRTLQGWEAGRPYPHPTILALALRRAA